MDNTITRSFIDKDTKEVVGTITLPADATENRWAAALSCFENVEWLIEE
jgi:hypothetical protein